MNTNGNTSTSPLPLLYPLTTVQTDPLVLYSCYSPRTVPLLFGYFIFSSLKQNLNLVSEREDASLPFCPLAASTALLPL